MAELLKTFTFIKDIAATVSVAHSTLLTNKIYDRVRVLNTKWFKRAIISEISTNAMIVPIIPKKVMMPKF